jgi:hypothetical protein
MDETIKRALKESITYALSRSLPKVPTRGPWKGLDPTQIAITANAVIEHLQLCGYQIERGPPITGIGVRPSLSDPAAEAG